MLRSSLVIMTTFLIVNCASANIAAPQHSQLPVIKNELLTQKWQLLNRQPANYPTEAAKIGQQGCATVEYVITPDYQIEDLKVVTTSNNYFTKSVKAAVRNWQWQQLPRGIISQPIKTQTSFKFCTEYNSKQCQMVTQTTDCSNDDVLIATASRVKYRH